MHALPEEETHLQMHALPEEQYTSSTTKIATVVPTQFPSDKYQLAVEEIDGSDNPRCSLYSERMSLHPSKTYPRISCTRGDSSWCDPPRRNVHLDCPDLHQMVGINRQGNIEIAKAEGRTIHLKEYTWNQLPVMKK